MNGYSSATWVPGCLQIFEEMKKAGFEPDGAAYHSLLRALSTSHRWQRCTEIVDLMESKGLQPTVATYNLAITGLASAGVWEEALAMHARMEAAG